MNEHGLLLLFFSNWYALIVARNRMQLIKAIFAAIYFYIPIPFIHPYNDSMKTKMKIFLIKLCQFYESEPITQTKHVFQKHAYRYSHDMI